VAFHVQLDGSGVIGPITHPPTGWSSTRIIIEDISDPITKSAEEPVLFYQKQQAIYSWKKVKKMS